MVNVDKEKYLELMEARLRSYFEIEKDKMLENETFDLYGKYHMILGRTFLSKKDIIDKFETNEHTMIKCVNHLEQKELEEYLAYLSELPKKLVSLNKFLICNKIKPSFELISYTFKFTTHCITVSFKQCTTSYVFSTY